MIIFGPDGLSGWSSKRKPVKDPLQQGNLKELIKAGIDIVWSTLH